MEESFRELKEEVESQEATYTYKQSLVSFARCYYNLQRINHSKIATISKVFELLRIIIEYRYNYETKDKELNTKLKDLKKNLILIERDVKKTRKEIERIALLLE